MEKIIIGKITTAVALKGEVKVYNYSDYKERFEEISSIQIKGPSGQWTSYKIEHVRYLKDIAILKLAGINDRNGAERLRGLEVYISEDQLRKLPEDTFYIKDLIGIRAIDGYSNEEIGVLTDVIQNGPQDIYVIKLKSGKETMIPAVGVFVKEINPEDRFIKLELIPGFIDEAGIEIKD